MQHELGALASKALWRSEGRGSAAVGGHGHGKDDVVYGADARVTTGSVCEDHPAAEACHRYIVDFIQHHVRPMLARQPVAFAGIVIVYKAE